MSSTKNQRGAIETTRSTIKLRAGGDATQTIMAGDGGTHSTIEMPATSTRLTGTDTTDTLENKSISAEDNTITDLDNSTIAADAGIEVSKLEALTASRVLATDANGEIVPSDVTTTTLAFVDPTSSIQTQLDAKASASGLSTHIADVANPHAVTKTQVGLGNVDNTSDVSKPVSTAQQTALDLKAPLANPTFTGTVSGVTKSMVGLGNIDNTSDATKNSAVAVLTNKDFDGGTASDTSRITVPKDTYANLLLLTRKEGTLLYATDLDTFFADDGTNLTPVGSGSGQGEKNYIDNPSASTAITGWTAVGDLTLSRTTTASELPREHTTGTGIKIVADADTQSVADYVYYDFTLDDVDLTRKLTIKWSQKVVGTYTAGQLAVILTTQADRTTALITPVTTAIPAGDTVDFVTTFDTQGTAALSLVIRATGDMTTDGGIVISDVVVGPGIVSQTSPVGEPVAVTVTGTWVTNTTYTAFETRIGSLARYDIKISLAGAPNATSLFVNLPSGRTINTALMASTTAAAANLLPNSTCALYDLSINSYIGGIYYNNSTSIGVVWTDDDAVSLKYSAAVNATGPFVWASGDAIHMSFIVPIAEWAGQTLNIGQGAQVEYASGAITSDASTTTTIYGPAGSRTPTAVLSGTRYVEVTWQYPRQNGDMVFLEIDYMGDGRWAPYDANEYGSFAYQQQNTSSYGMYLNHPTPSTTRINFSIYAYPSGATYGVAGAGWNTLVATMKWRIRKVSASSPVGFGMAGTDGSAGLYKAGQAPGQVTGATIASGYIGEVKLGTATGVALTTTTATVTSVTLSPGVWLITANFRGFGGASTAGFEVGIATTGASKTGWTDYNCGEIAQNGNNRGSVTYTEVVNTAGTPTYYLTANTNASTGTANGGMRAVRIA